ncbi:MAG: hypothetical protein ACREOH_10580 [Candidatus Entotheonellia bacterium]
MPEGQQVYLRDRGIGTFPLAAVNAILEPLRYVIHATKARDRQRAVACMDRHGRVEPYGLFELRPITEEHNP